LKADEVLFRFRYAAHGVIYALGFWAPWDRWLELDGSRTTWLELAGWLAQNRWLSFSEATIAVLAFGILCAWVGAWLRTWGTAYLGGAVVKGPEMESAGANAAGVVANGPYRHLRNPLYLGTWVHTFALALLMPPSGAVFAIVAIGVLQLLLIRGEERFLAAKLGDAYARYRALVPRLVPPLRGPSENALARGGAALPRRGAGPKWLQAVLGEIYFCGVAVSFAALGRQYNARLLTQCVLVSLGVAMVMRAALMRQRPAA
jgi:protein-S-isoprenylcysteine O-methyltransferase Ste14